MKIESKFALTLKGQTLELTKEEATSLFNELSKVLGKSSQEDYYKSIRDMLEREKTKTNPIKVPDYPYLTTPTAPYYPEWEIWCQS